MCVNFCEARGGRSGSAKRRTHRLRERGVLVAVVSAFAAYSPDSARAGDPAPVIQTGLPTSTVPVFKEPGAPNFSYPDGSTSTGGAAGGGTVGSSGGSGGGGADQGGSALNTMMGQSWGPGASGAASAIGVNPSALAATCVLESGCQNTGAAAGGSASGAFQMINSTYSQDINAVAASGLVPADQIDTSLAGKMDPANEAYAAAWDLKQAAVALQNDGIPNPTVLDTRAIYQFGLGAGPDIARADPSETISSLVSLTPSQLAANGLTASTTVGEWRQTISTKLGSTANQVVLKGG